MADRIPNRNVRQMELRAVCDSGRRFRDMQVYKHPHHHEMKRRERRGR